MPRGLNAAYNGSKGCWEFRYFGKIIRTCFDEEFNETVYELIEQYQL